MTRFIKIVAPMLALGLSGPAFADGAQARCTVRIIHAVDQEPDAKTGKSEPKIDAKIEKLRPYLQKAPFTAWHEFVLLEKKDLDLKEKEPQSFTLPNGKPASLAFVEHLPDQAGSPHRIRLQLEIGDPARPKMKTVFVVPEGGVVLEAGTHYKHGVLILGTSCDHPH